MCFSKVILSCSPSRKDWWGPFIKSKTLTSYGHLYYYFRPFDVGIGGHTWMSLGGGGCKEHPYVHAQAIMHDMVL